MDMGVLDIFWLICRIAMALLLFIAVCLGVWFLFSYFLRRMFMRVFRNERTLKNERIQSDRIESNREWLLTLDRVHLLMLSTEADSGFDKQDKEDIVHIAGNVYSDEEKSVIVNRLAKHLSHQFKY